MAKGSGLAIGIAMGAALGAAFGNISLGIALGLVFGIIFDASNARKNGEKTGARNTAQIHEKQAHVEQLKTLFRERKELTNDDAQTALSVSDATAQRYLDELERSGSIEQIGEQGRGVRYRMK